MIKSAMQLLTVMVFYIGNKPIKRDTVGGGTELVWRGYGDYHEVPRELATKFLMHDKVWTDEAGFKALQKAGKDKGTSEITKERLLTAAEIEANMGLSDAVLSEAEEESSDEPEQAETTITKAKNDNEPPSDIRSAILSLEEGNLAHFTENGRPRIEVIREILNNQTIVTRDVTQVWQEILKEREGK